MRQGHYAVVKRPKRIRSPCSGQRHGLPSHAGNVQHFPYSKSKHHGHTIYIYIQFLITMDWWPSPRWVYHPSKYPTMALSVSTWESGNLICTPVWRRLWHRSCLEQAGHGRGGHGGHGHGPRFGLAISPRMPLWLNKKHVWTRLIIHTIYIYMYTCMVILCCTTYVY